MEPSGGAGDKAGNYAGAGAYADAGRLAGAGAYADAGRLCRRGPVCKKEHSVQNFFKKSGPPRGNGPSVQKTCIARRVLPLRFPSLLRFLYVFRGVSTHIFLVLKEGLTPCIQSFFRCLKDCLKNFLPSSALRPRFCFETRFFSQSSAPRGCFCLSPVSNHSGLCFGPRFCLEPALTAFPAGSR